VKLATDLTDYSAGELGLVELAATYLNDRVHKMWAKSELVVYVNDAQWALAAEINKIHKEYFLKFDQAASPQAGTAYYTMPADLAMLVGLEIIEGASDREPQEMVAVHVSDRRFYEGLQEATRKDDYRFFFVAGTSLKMLPEPGVVGAGELMRFHYIKRLTQLVANADVSEIPLQHHELLAMDTARRALIKTKQGNAQLEMMRAERFAAMEAEVRVFTVNREERVEPWYGTFGPPFPVEWPPRGF
jgi:hypothetical protein